MTRAEKIEAAANMSVDDLIDSLLCAAWRARRGIDKDYVPHEVETRDVMREEIRTRILCSAGGRAVEDRIEDARAKP